MTSRTELLTFSRHHKFGFVAAIFEAIELRRQRRALAEMPDHLLKDIGLTREEANQEAQRPIWS